MSLLPGLETELLGAARRTDPSVATKPAVVAVPAHRLLRRAAGRHGGRRRRHVGLWTLVGVLAFSGGAYAARGVWQPILGSDDGGHPPVSREAPPSPQFSVLGVLRRPQTDADRGLASTVALKGFQPREGAIRTAWVRRLATLPNGSVAVLVPVDRNAPGDTAYQRRDGAQLCIAIVPTRGVMEPPTCGATWQVLVGEGLSVMTWDPFTARQERDRAAAIRKAQRAGQLPATSSATVTVDPAVTAAIERATYAGGGSPGASYTVSLVPDVVRRVRYFQEPGKPEVAVKGNVVVRKVADGQQPGLTSWIDADGRTLNADGVRVAPSAIVP